MNSWPKLDFPAEKRVYETCHLILQLIGKLPTRLHPWINHGWHVALQVTPQGFATRTMPGPERGFSVEFDIYSAALVVSCQPGKMQSLPVAGKTVAELHGELTQMLTGMGLPAPLWGGPNEMPDPVPFAQDHRPRIWEQDVAERLHGAFLSCDSVFSRFRSLYCGKSSPSHLFWGSFDLAVTRFSGRRAPPHPGGIPGLPDSVTREAYSHEVISAGFWPGGNGVEEAAFYAYTYPTPDGLSDLRIAPEGAGWNAGLGEFVLPYRLVAEAAEPDRALTAFLQSTYDGAARLLDWPEGLARREAAFGHPPS